MHPRLLLRSPNADRFVAMGGGPTGVGHSSGLHEPDGQLSCVQADEWFFALSVSPPFPGSTESGTSFLVAREQEMRPWRATS